ncbi:hypothetical protein [Mucilaginibacter kameinonensis]|uniref:hypothetical protein n=1 Tax=Mucilaginibacter kameinonensis TaxID=452286 RepID=UPI000EF7E038|nr:hypothetical protein [Mucilaginibacter kameinonensis]
MILIGFIQTGKPRVLINPIICRNETEAYTWLASFFNDENFKLDSPLTQLKVSQSLAEKVPVLIAIAGYEAAIMFGDENIIMQNIDRIFNTDLFDYKDLMAK